MMRSEQETTFRYSADEDYVHVFTAHPPTARKIERAGYTPYKTTTRDGVPNGWFFRIRREEFRWRIAEKKKRTGRTPTPEQIEKMQAGRRQAAQIPPVA
jgi:hypothetical protein